MLVGVIQKMIPIENDLALIYINIAKDMIKEYLNNPKYEDAYIISRFESAIIVIVEDLYAKKGKSNIKSESQGRRSISYVNDTDIIKTVANLLPKPYVSVR